MLLQSVSPAAKAKLAKAFPRDSPVYHSPPVFKQNKEGSAGMWDYCCCFCCWPEGGALPAPAFPGRLVEGRKFRFLSPDGCGVSRLPVRRLTCSGGPVFPAGPAFHPVVFAEIPFPWQHKARLPESRRPGCGLPSRSSGGECLTARLVSRLL